MSEEIKDNVKKIRDYFYTTISCSCCGRIEDNSLNRELDFAAYLHSAGWRVTGSISPAIECPACVEGWRNE